MKKFYEVNTNTGCTTDNTEKILDMFKKIICFYAENNPGKKFYEHILFLLRRMSEFDVGKKAAMDLLKEFKITYKNRSLMLEILTRFKS